MVSLVCICVRVWFFCSLMEFFFLISFIYFLLFFIFSSLLVCSPPFQSGFTGEKHMLAAPSLHLSVLFISGGLGADGGGEKNKTKKTLRSLPDFCPGFSCQIVAMPHSFLSGSVVVIKGITDDLGHHTPTHRRKQSQGCFECHCSCSMGWHTSCVVAVWLIVHIRLVDLRQAKDGKSCHSIYLIFECII